MPFVEFQFERRGLEDCTLEFRIFSPQGKLFSGTIPSDSLEVKGETLTLKMPFTPAIADALAEYSSLAWTIAALNKQGSQVGRSPLAFVRIAWSE